MTAAGMSRKASSRTALALKCRNYFVGFAEEPQSWKTSHRMENIAGMSAIVVVLRAFFFVVALEGQLDQAVKQRRVSEPARFPHFGIHANGCETGYSIYLIQVNISLFFIHE